MQIVRFEARGAIPQGHKDRIPFRGIGGEEVTLTAVGSRCAVDLALGARIASASFMTEDVAKNHVRFAHIAPLPQVHVIPVLSCLPILGRGSLCMCLGESFRDLWTVAGIVGVRVSYPSGDEVFGETGKCSIHFVAPGGALDFNGYGIEWTVELAVIFKQWRAALPFDEIGAIGEPDEHVEVPRKGLKGLWDCRGKHSEMTLNSMCGIAHTAGFCITRGIS